MRKNIFIINNSSGMILLVFNFLWSLILKFKIYIVFDGVLTEKSLFSFFNIKGLSVSHKPLPNFF